MSIPDETWIEVAGSTAVRAHLVDVVRIETAGTERWRLALTLRGGGSPHFTGELTEEELRPLLRRLGVPHIKLPAPVSHDF